jgi:ABC-type uncharacterized transport system permease subunit
LGEEGARPPVHIWLTPVLVVIGRWLQDIFVIFIHFEVLCIVVHAFNRSDDLFTKENTVSVLALKTIKQVFRYRFKTDKPSVLIVVTNMFLELSTMDGFEQRPVV